MKKLVTLAFLLLSTYAFADVDNPTEWTEQDGSPSVYDPWKVSVSNGTLTDNGDGSISVNTGGGSGSPGGSDTQLQYNNAGNFGGIPDFTYSSTTATSTSGSLMAGIFTVGTSTGVRFTATGGVLTMTEQNGSGTKNELSLDLENNSRITAKSNTRNALLWTGAGGASTFGVFSNSAGSFLDSTSNSAADGAFARLSTDGNNDWQLIAGGTASTRPNDFSITSSVFGDAAHFDKTTGQATFLGGDVTTSTIRAGSGGAGIDYKFLQVDGETYDLNQVWKEDEAVLTFTSSLANENMAVSFGQTPAGFSSVLDILPGFGYSAFGIGSPLVSAGFIVQGVESTSGNGPTLFLGVDAGTPLSSGTEIGSIQFGGSGAAPSDMAVQIQGKADGAWSGTSTPGLVSIQTVPAGSTGPGGEIERLAIYSDGRAVFNETGVSTADFRMESDNDANMFVMDSSADTVSFGSASTVIGRTGTLGFITTTSVAGTGTVGNTQAFMGKGGTSGCIMMRDTDNAGWTECTVLNGTLTCGIDADGVCDGTA